MARIIKIGLAALAVTVGTLAVSVATNGISEAPTLGAASGSERERTLVINNTSHISDVKVGNRNATTSIVFPFSDGLAYGLIGTTQAQYELTPSDNAVLVLWGHNPCEFYINYKYYDGEKFTKDSEELTIVKFNHLSQIDIKLNKGDGTDRLLELTSEVNGDAKGVFAVIEDTSSYIQYSWKPDNQGGYITTTDELTFKAVAPISGKAVWVTDMVFHYMC